MKKTHFVSIQKKIIFFFLTGLIITLTIAIAISYAFMNNVFMNINTGITNAEFDQISHGIESLFSEVTAAVSSQVIFNQEVQTISRYNRITESERVKAIKELSGEVAQITRIYPCVDSVFIKVRDELLLGFSSRSTRQFFNPNTEWLSGNLLSAVSQAQTPTQIIGCMRSSDFPLDMENTSYLISYKELPRVEGTTTVFTCMKEESVCDLYREFMADGLRTIRILDNAGTIVSSAEKDEIGTFFSPLEGVQISESGTRNENGVVLNYVPVPAYGLVITSMIPKTIYTKELTTIRNCLIWTFSISMLALSICFILWIRDRLKRLHELQEGMVFVGRGDYSHRLSIFGNDEFSELAVKFNAMMSELQTMDIECKNAEVEIRERELKALRNEINPHFLYNTLNTIKCMADIEGNDEISKCIVALGGIVAPLYKVKSPTWTLREEVTLIQKYLVIMNVRYNHNIDYSEMIPEDLEEEHVMRFILQPIIENSILHGFAGRGYAGHISLCAERQDTNILLIIEDDGCGLDDARICEFNREMSPGEADESVGMLNVNRRIRLRYGNPYGITLSHSSSGGLRTTIRLPMELSNP